MPPTTELEYRGPSTVEATKLPFPVGFNRLFPKPEKRLSCVQCSGEQFKLVCPMAWPIETVAVSCVTCGTVAGYFDEGASRELRGADLSRERLPREFVVSHRIGRRVRTPDEQREAVLLGLREGIEVDQIAEDLDVTPEYVHSVGVNEGLIHDRGEWHEQITPLAAQGKCAREIAEALKQRVSAVRAAARRRCIALPAPRTLGAEIRKRYLAGERPCDIARSLGVQPSYVSRACARLRN